MNTHDRQHVYFTAVASCFASMIAKFVIYPIETIKTKVQVAIRRNSGQYGDKAIPTGIDFKLSEEDCERGGN
jgi:hypothetical protein